MQHQSTANKWRLPHSVGLSLLLVTSIAAAIETGDSGRCYSDYTSPGTIADLRALGLEPVTAHGATPTIHSDDDTEEIQNAIFAAMEDCVNDARPLGTDTTTYIDGCRAVFFPPGAYTVSDTIRVMQPLRPADGVQLKLALDSAGNVTYNDSTKPPLGTVLHESGANTGSAARRKSNVLIGSSCVWNRTKTRPIIKARPGTFADANNPKPLVQFWAQCRDGGSACNASSDDIGSTAPAHGQGTVLFNNIFRNIDIDANVGSGTANIGAIGIDFPGAQGSALEDSDITMTNGIKHGHTGIRNIPGQSGGIYNITVKGGRYGIWMDKETRFGMAVGVRLFNQTDNAIYHAANNKVTIIGFHITQLRTDSGNAVRIDAASWNGIAMVDGVLNVNNNQPALFVKDRPVYLRNVYVRGAGSTLATTSTSHALNAAGTGKWQRIVEWAYSSSSAASGTPRWMENGVVGFAPQGSERVETVLNGASPGSTANIEALLVAPHVWKAGDLPSFEDVSSVIVLARTGSDNTAVDLDIYLNQPDSRVFLGGGGRHPINKTVTLRDKQALAGLDRVHTVIETASSADRNDALWCAANAAMVSTTNDPHSSVRLGRVSLAEHAKCTSFIPFQWKAGQNSQSHGVMVTRSDTDESPTYAADPGQVAFEFSESAGGRHWGLQPEPAMIESQTDDLTYRHLKISNTSNPLDIYGFNCEKVSGGSYACELLNAQNVNLYNVKAETCKQCGGGAHRTTAKPILRLHGTRNVSVIGYGGIARPGEDSRAVIEISDANTSNLTLALINPNTSAATSEGSGPWYVIQNYVRGTAIAGPFIASYIREN